MRYAAPWFFLILAAACAVRSRQSFQVNPASPYYLLQDPDKHETSFPEILRSYNGFVRGRPSIDLRPDMELRIENAYYQPGMPRRGLDGYLGTEVARYKMHGHSGLELLSVRSMSNRPAAQLPVQALIPARVQRLNYFRFYYEVLFRRTGQPRNSALLGAPSESEIARLSQKLEADPDAVCRPGSSNCAVFPDACSVSVEMEIVVNGAPRNVLWGSTLAEVAEHPRAIALRRLYKGHLRPVKLDPSDSNALRLTLLPGDHVKWS